MDAQQFAYWLQGFSELSGNEPPTSAQWASIREHLALVFKKVTPPLTGPFFADPIDLSKLRIGSPSSPNCIAGRPSPVRAECSSGQWIQDPLGDGNTFYLG